MTKLRLLVAALVAVALVAITAPAEAGLQFSTTLRNGMLDQITTAVGGSCLVRIYSGTAPANVGTAFSGNTLLAELPCSATAAPASSGGVLTFNSITTANAAATGTAAFFRFYKSDGTTVVIQGTVGTSGADLNLVTTSITSGQPVQITSWTITAPGQ